MYQNILCNPLKFHGFTVQPGGAILVNNGKLGFASGWVSVNNGGVYADDVVYLAFYLETDMRFELN